MWGREHLGSIWTRRVVQESTQVATCRREVTDENRPLSQQERGQGAKEVAESSRDVRKVNRPVITKGVSDIVEEMLKESRW